MPSFYMPRAEEKEGRKKKKEKKKKREKEKKERTLLCALICAILNRFKKKNQEVACQTKGSSVVAKKFDCYFFCIFESAMAQKTSFC